MELFSSTQTWCIATESDLQTIAVPDSTSCAGSEGKKHWVPHLWGVWAELCKQITLAVELFTDWLTEALVTDLSELIVWLSFTVFPSSPLQLLHVITGNLSASHLQKDIMKSNSKDIHSFLLDYLPWLQRWGVDGLFPTAPHSGHLHTQCRQGLAALQQLLHASLASETTLMIMWDTQVSSLNGSFYLLSIKGGM